MKCPFCGKHSDLTVCPFCGFDKSYAETIRHTADRFYREGYTLAASGDLYHAEALLKQALFYDGKDTRTLNLLGLVYYRTGQIGEAISMWKESIVADERSENRAYGYIDDLNHHETRLNAMTEAVRLYNDALEQAKTGSLDYAIARLKKAASLNRHNVKVQLLLALCYIEQKRFKQAIACLDKAARRDPLHPLVARYRKWITDLAAEGETDADDDDIQDVSDTHSVRSSLKEPDLVEIFGPGKTRRVSLRSWHMTLNQIGMFIVGAACMFAFIYLLLMPSQLSGLRKENADMQEEVTTRMAEMDRMQQDVLRAQQYEYEAEQKVADLEKDIESLNRQLGRSGETDMDDALARAVLSYFRADYATLATLLTSINEESLNADSKELYSVLFNYMSNGTESLYNSGMENYQLAQDALTDEERAEYLQLAHDALQAAARFAEEQSSRRYYALYYYGMTCYQMGDYQETLDVCEEILSTYVARDTYYDWVISLQGNAQAQMNG